MGFSANLAALACCWLKHFCTLPKLLNSQLCRRMTWSDQFGNQDLDWYLHENLSSWKYSLWLSWSFGLTITFVKIVPPICASDHHFILSWWATSADNLAKRDGIYEEGIEAEMELFWDKKLASVVSEAEGGPGMAVVVVLVVGEVGNGRAGPLMLQKRGSRLRPTHLGRPCCPIFVVLFSTFWDDWVLCLHQGGRSRLVCGVLMQFERVYLEVFSTSRFAPLALNWRSDDFSPLTRPGPQLTS